VLGLGLGSGFERRRLAMRDHLQRQGVRALCSAVGLLRLGFGFGFGFGFGLGLGLGLGLG